MGSEKQYLDLYRENEVLVATHSCGMMNALRRGAHDVLARQGFPTLKTEDYRYTDVDEAFAPDYGINVRRLPFVVDRSSAFRCSVPNMGVAMGFMVGDRLTVPATTHWPEGVTVDSICNYDRQHPGRLAEYYGRLAPWGTDAVAALNTMLAQDGLLIWVEKGRKTDATLQIVNLGCGEMDLMTNRRILIIMEEGAKASVLMCDHNIDRHRFLTTQVGEIYMGEGSSLSLCGIEETDGENGMFDNLYVMQQKNSSFDGGFFSLHCGLTRRSIDVKLAGEGARAELFGGVTGDAASHVDTNLLVDHVAGGCKSNVLFKYVLDGKSTGAFAGKVLVRKDAQKTESQETNANLCVSPEARMYTQPMLEIYADDVRCNHGSTVGRLDEKALFYMAQRGIPEEEANMLLQEAFLGDAIRMVKIEPLRERLYLMVRERFRHKLGGCGGCDKCATK